MKCVLKYRDTTEGRGVPGDRRALSLERAACKVALGGPWELGFQGLPKFPQRQEQLTYLSPDSFHQVHVVPLVTGLEKQKA